MKKIIPFTLAAALATTMIDIPTASAETNMTATAATYEPIKLMEIKDGQLDENGIAYFELTVPQEGYYRLVGTNIGRFQTAVSTDASTLEDAPLQYEPKSRILNKGTYYVKVKGTPNDTYHFKFKERTFDLDKAWPESTDTIASGLDQQNVVDFPYYANRQVSATLKLTEDKHIRFYGSNAKGVKALTLKNVDTDKTYTAKKISNYTFSSNAPNGTYAVSPVMTDEFIAKPYVSKIRLSYTLGEHLPLNDTASTADTPFNTFSLNLKKDTKITFTLLVPTQKNNFNRTFSIYNDKHQLVKRVHILAGKSSRTFTYTVKKGRYSIAASDMNIQAMTKDGSSQGTLTLKNGLLVVKKTGKAVKGYKVYKEKLYKDGKLTTGHVKYGKVPNMKLYYNGALNKGVYIAKGYKYAFKDGALIKGTYKYETENGIDAIFEDGVLSHLMELKGGTLYDNGKVHKGRYVLNTYDYEENEIDGTYLTLYINGKKATGYEEGTYNGETYMFKNGVPGDGRYGFYPFYYDGKVYVHGKPTEDYVFVGDVLYYQHQLFTGERDDRYYENGVRKYYFVTKAYENKLKEAVDLKAQIGQQSDEAIAASLKEKVTEVFAYLDDKDNKERIYDDYGHMQYDDQGENGYKDPSNIRETIRKQLEEIDDVAKQLGDAGAETHASLQQHIKNVYLDFQLHYENGALLDGEYEGNLYDKGKYVNAILNLAFNRTNSEFLNHERSYNTAVSNKDESNIQEQLQPYVDAYTAHLKSANDIVKASQDPDYPKVSLITEGATSTINRSLEKLRFIQNVMNTYGAQADLTELQATMTAGFALLGKTIAFQDPDPTASYKELKLDDVQEGSFDDNGYAYFKVDLPDVEGNYAFVGSDDVASYTTMMSTNAENVAQAEQVVATKLRYLQQGTQYVVVKGQPNQAYHFKLQRRAYSVETTPILGAWTPVENKIVDIPIYQINQPTTTVKLTTNQHIQFSAISSDSKMIDSIELKNLKTGKTYSIKRGKSYTFGAFVPNGTYSVLVKSSRPSNAQHVTLSYSLSPTLMMNKKVDRFYGLHDTFSLAMNKDTKMQFKLSARYIPDSNQKFEMYNDKDELVKRVTLKAGELSREFTYTVKKGNYYILLNGSNILLTATPK